MRLSRLLPLLGFLALTGFAVAPPLHAAAGTTSGPHLALSPAQGTPGSHFTATFTYSVSVCSKYKVWLFWDAPSSSSDVLGTGEPTNTDTACQVSIPATIPADASSTTHTLDASAHLDSGNGTAVWSSNDPDATATYVVTPAPSQRSSSPSPSSSSSASASRPGGSSPGATASPTAAALALAGGQGSPEDSATTSSATSGDAPASDTQGQSSPVLHPIRSVVPSPSHGLGATVVLFALPMALLAGVGLVVAGRSGRLRLPRGRR